MRIRELRLDPFGHFTDARLDLAGGSGLHIVCTHSTNCHHHQLHHLRAFRLAFIDDPLGDGERLFDFAFSSFAFLNNLSFRICSACSCISLASSPRSPSSSSASAPTGTESIAFVRVGFEDGPALVLSGLDEPVMYRLDGLCWCACSIPSSYIESGSSSSVTAPSDWFVDVRVIRGAGGVAARSR